MSQESRQKWLNLEDEFSKDFLEKNTKEQIAQLFHRLLLDTSETDTFIRNEAKKVLDNSLVDGDNWGVPPIENIVEMLVKEIEESKKMNKDFMNPQFTPENITELADNQVFVFGSNRAWRHGAGAAHVAMKKFGAVYGEGPFRGQSYGISTKDENIKTLPLSEIKKEIDEFVSFAANRPELEFLVTKVGTGLSKYKIEDIAELFRNRKYIPPNIVFPKEFFEYIYGIKI
jgi:hypothetical protein